MKYLAFDLGGSGGKLFLADHQDRTIQLEEIHRFSHHPLSLSGHLYWDLFHIYQEVLTGVRKAVAEYGDDIACIGFDSFCNDFTLVSPEGEILIPLHCYRDKRALRHRDAFFNIMSPQELYRINGNQNAPFNTLPHLHAMQMDGNGYLLNQDTKLVFVSDLLIYLLTGKFTCEFTTASVTQMLDYKTHDWADKVLDSYGISRDLFPPILDPGTIVGYTTAEFNNSVDTKGFEVATVCQHDTASAFLAALPLEHRAIISCGTWSIVGVESDMPVITDYGFAHNIANEGSTEGHHRLLINVMGTWILQEMRRELAHQGTEYSFGEIEVMAQASGMPECIIDVDHPAFYTPGDMINKVIDTIADQYGIRPQSLGFLFYTVYASLAAKYRLAVEKLEMLTGTSINVIQMLGGGCQSELMCKLTANMCGRPVIAGPVEATALGNVLMQMKATSQIQDVTEGRQIIQNSTSYKKHHPHDEEFIHWDKLYKAFIKQKGE